MARLVGRLWLDFGRFWLDSGRLWLDFGRLLAGSLGSSTRMSSPVDIHATKTSVRLCNSLVKEDAHLDIYNVLCVI